MPRLGRPPSGGTYETVTGFDGNPIQLKWRRSSYYDKLTPTQAFKTCDGTASTSLDELKEIISVKGMDWLNEARHVSGSTIPWSHVHYAATRPTDDTLIYLYEHNAVMNQLTYKEMKNVPAGSTALHVAVVARRLPCVRYLLTVADESFIEYKNTEGQTARDLIELTMTAEKLRQEYHRAFDEWEKRNQTKESQADGSGVPSDLSRPPSPTIDDANADADMEDVEREDVSESPSRVPEETKLSETNDDPMDADDTDRTSPTASSKRQKSTKEKTKEKSKERSASDPSNTKSTSNSSKKKRNPTNREEEKQLTSGDDEEKSPAAVSRSSKTKRTEEDGEESVASRSTRRKRAAAVEAEKQQSDDDEQQSSLSKKKRPMDEDDDDNVEDQQSDASSSSKKKRVEMREEKSSRTEAKQVKSNSAKKSLVDRTAGDEKSQRKSEKRLRKEPTVPATVTDVEESKHREPTDHEPTSTAPSAVTPSAADDIVPVPAVEPEIQEVETATVERDMTPEVRAQRKAERAARRAAKAAAKLAAKSAETARASTTTFVTPAKSSAHTSLADLRAALLAQARSLKKEPKVASAPAPAPASEPKQKKSKRSRKETNPDAEDEPTKAPAPATTEKSHTTPSANTDGVAEEPHAVDSSPSEPRRKKQKRSNHVTNTEAEENEPSNTNANTTTVSVEAADEPRVNSAKRKQPRRTTVTPAATRKTPTSDEEGKDEESEEEPKEQSYTPAPAPASPPSAPSSTPSTPAKSPVKKSVALTLPKPKRSAAASAFAELIDLISPTPAAPPSAAHVAHHKQLTSKKANGKSNANANANAKSSTSAITTEIEVEDMWAGASTPPQGPVVPPRANLAPSSVPPVIPSPTPSVVRRVPTAAATAAVGPPSVASTPALEPVVPTTTSPLAVQSATGSPFVTPFFLTQTIPTTNGHTHSDSDDESMESPQILKLPPAAVTANADDSQRTQLLSDGTLFVSPVITAAPVLMPEARPTQSTVLQSDAPPPQQQHPSPAMVPIVQRQSHAASPSPVPTAAPTTNSRRIQSVIPIPLPAGASRSPHLTYRPVRSDNHPPSPTPSTPVPASPIHLEDTDEPMAQAREDDEDDDEDREEDVEEQKTAADPLPHRTSRAHVHAASPAHGSFTTPTATSRRTSALFERKDIEAASAPRSSLPPLAFYPPLANPTPFHSIVEVLEYLSLSRYLPLFEKEDINIPRLLLLTQEDVQTLLPTLGSRKELWAFIQRCKREEQAAAQQLQPTQINSLVISPQPVQQTVFGASPPPFVPPVARSSIEPSVDAPMPPAAAAVAASTQVAPDTPPRREPTRRPASKKRPRDPETDDSDEENDESESKEPTQEEPSEIDLESHPLPVPQRSSSTPTSSVPTAPISPASRAVLSNSMKKRMKKKQKLQQQKVPSSTHSKPSTTL